IYYGGELVWRERDRRTNEMFDACPVPDWAFIAPKIAAISIVLVAMLAISVLAAAGGQTIKGYTNYEWLHYLDWYIVPEGIKAVLFATLAIFVQVVSPHKYVGWGVMVIVLISMISLGNVGYDDNLYIYGSWAPVPLSDMNGQGQFWIQRAWLEAYW